MNGAFAILGLRPDADERAIKRAYAAQLKTTRPDEDPEGFQRLNEAYQAGLAACAARDDAQGALLDPPLPTLPQADATREAAPPDATRTPAFALPPSLLCWRTRGRAQAAFTANDPDTAPMFDMDAFFRELHARARREPVAAFRTWLHGHEALYAMTLKDATAVPLVHFLAGVRPMRCEHLDVVLRFFGLDTVSPRTQRLEVLLHRLREDARPPAGEVGMGRFSLLVWILLIGLYAIICIAHLFEPS